MVYYFVAIWYEQLKNTSQEAVMMHKKTAIEQCIWKIQNIQKGFFIICKSWSKSVGATVKDAPALSLTPGCVVFLLSLVLMLTLHFWLNPNPYQKILIMIGLLNQWTYPAHQLAKWIVMPKKAHDENCMVVIRRWEEQGEGA